MRKQTIRIQIPNKDYTDFVETVELPVQMYYTAGSNKWRYTLEASKLIEETKANLFRQHGVERTETADNIIDCGYTCGNNHNHVLHVHAAFAKELELRSKEVKLTRYQELCCYSHPLSYVLFKELIVEALKKYPTSLRLTNFWTDVRGRAANDSVANKAFEELQKEGVIKSDGFRVWLTYQ